MRPVIIALLLVYPAMHASAQETLVAAASDLRFALDSVASAFQKQHGGNVKVTYGSSGKLCEQIIHGAPFDVYFSADIAYAQKLEKEKKAGSALHIYALGRIVLWSKRIDVKEGMDALLNASVSKIAIANPAHAPYGQRAMESMAYYRLTSRVRDKLVYGENISQAAQFISSGAADIGIIALSLALSPTMTGMGGRYFLIPDTTHKPLEQAAVVTARGKENALAVKFFQFIQSERAIAILAHFGFKQP